jgi:hypothetical protein
VVALLDLCVAGCWRCWRAPASILRRRAAAMAAAGALPPSRYADDYVRIGIEVLNVKVGVFILLIFATLPECRQNQTAVSDTLRLLSDF